LNKEDWHNQHAWILDYIIKFRSTFRERIKKLDAGDYVPEEELENLD